MRLLTFNLRTSYARGDGPNLWEKRRDDAAETILDLNPDLCGLQEMDPAMWKDLEPHLGSWQVLKGRAQTGPHENGNGLLVRKDSFEILESGRFWLSDSPERESVSFPHEWGPRIVFWARVRPLKSKEPFVVATTHFDTHKESWRPAAWVALEQLGRVGGGSPVFLMGDFNSRAGSPAWELLRGAGFQDSWSELGLGDDKEIFTFHSFTGRDKTEVGRIDWILHRGPWKASRCVIDRRNKSGFYPSDHFPVWAEYP